MKAARPLFDYDKYWAECYGTAPFLPMSRAEMDNLGWDSCDVIIVTGDAYVDHPSFGMAIIGRLLEAQGFRVGIIAQPDWHSKEPFEVLGKPNLFFGVAAGNMDSMINRYTADRKVRNDDAYSPGGQPGRRPDRATLRTQIWFAVSADVAHLAIREVCLARHPGAQPSGVDALADHYEPADSTNAEFVDAVAELSDGTAISTRKLSFMAGMTACPAGGWLSMLTGALLSAEPYVPVNWASHVDLETEQSLVPFECPVDLHRTPERAVQTVHGHGDMTRWQL